MIRSRLKNHFNKTRSGENWSLCKTQRHFCTKLLRKERLRNVNPKLVLYNKTVFQRQMQLFLENNHFRKRLRGF